MTTRKKKPAPPSDPCRVCSDDFTCAFCNPEKNAQDNMRKRDEAESKLWKYEVAWRLLRAFHDDHQFLREWPSGYDDLFELCDVAVKGGRND